MPRAPAFGGREHDRRPRYRRGSKRSGCLWLLSDRATLTSRIRLRLRLRTMTSRRGPAMDPFGSLLLGARKPACVELFDRPADPGAPHFAVEGCSSREPADERAALRADL